MKKSLTALAALAACGLASAQSAVTLFGVIDAGVSDQRLTARDPLNSFSGSNRQSQWSVSNSGYNASRLGFRGSEDLGGGMAASFWLEAPLGNDDGGTGLAFTRRSTVSLSGGFGEFRLGRDDTATYWNDAVFDPFGAQGSGTSLISTVGAGAALGNSQYARASNTIAYFLPANLGGFYGQAQYSLHENTDTRAATGFQSTASHAGRYVGGRFGYADGPLDIAIAVGQSVVVDTAALTRKVQTINLGASYDLGPVKLFGELSSVENRFGTVSGNRRDSYDGWLLGASMPLGAGLLRASYSLVRYQEGVAGLSGDSPRGRKFAIGYVYNLSRRTALYATIARIDNRNDALYTGSLISGGTTGFGNAAPGFTGLPRTSTGYDFGIRHAF